MSAGLRFPGGYRRPKTAAVLNPSEVSTVHGGVNVRQIDKSPNTPLAPAPSCIGLGGCCSDGQLRKNGRSIWWCVHAAAGP